jgi:hypothetical protein
VLLPLSLQNKDFRATFGQGLSVAPNKSSPAYAAFEDLHQRFEKAPSKFPENLETLAAGTRYQPSPALAAISVRSLAMKGMVVRVASEETPKPYYVAGEIRKTSDGPPVLADARGEMLSLQTRKSAISQYIRQNAAEWTPPSAAARAQQLVEEELSLPPPVSMARRDMRSVTGTPIVVAKADLRPDPVLPPQEEDVILPQPSLPSMHTVSPVADAQRPLWLNGQLEMTGGLAFAGSDQTTLVVKRVVSGEVLEKGRIWINEGRFEIFVKSATGQLVAELVATNGQVLGRGAMNLVHIRDVPTNDNRIYDIRISLRPTSETASLRTVSGYSHGNQMIPVKEARVEIQNYTNPKKVNDDGFFAEPTLTHESSYVARASAPKHWSTVVVGQAQHPQDVRLFSNKLMEALIGLEYSHLTERKEAGFASVVWGQIRRAGKAAEGATVEMAGNYRPIYLNELYLPDPNLKATSSNGLFAFVNVRRGVQALRVLSNGRMYPAQVFPTEDKHVSYLDLELEDKVVSHFKVFDVLNMNETLDARIRLVGTDDVVSIRKQGLVEYSSGANPFMVESEAGPEYEISRVTLTGKPQTIHVPMVRKEWLTGLFNKNNVMALPGRGMIVGFIDDQDFEVEITGYGAKEQMQIVYFDSRGQQVNQKHGMAGGGFVIFNAPAGLQTLYVHPVSSKETYAQVVVAEPEYVHVMSWAAGN